MKIHCFDLTFRELLETDLEAVRTWRNSDYVRSNMQDQRLISPEAQASWYERVCKGNHWYFIVEHANQPLGVANLKDLNQENRSAEAGLFMIREQYADGVHPMTCSVLLIHLAFDYLNLKSLFSASLVQNPHAGRFNQSLGFRLISDDQHVIRWSLDPQTGRSSRDRILALLAAYHKTDSVAPIRLSGDPIWPIHPSFLKPS